MATRSGTNAFHGSAAYLLRNENLDANTFSNNAQGIQKREFRVNDVGGAIGGPIRRNSVFFFSSYHGLRNNQGSTTLATVPTALERVGNFSQSFIRDESGNPVPARVFDPFNVVQEGPDLYRRVEAPNAIIANPHPAALRMFSFYPLPNRTPDDVFNTNNFEASTVQTVRRHSNNNRVDWRAGKHSIYASGGISYATITTPRPFGETPFNGAAGIRSDDNPYFQIGDSIVLSRSVVVDLRYGLSHIDTKAFTGDKEGFTEFDAFGVPANLQPLMAFPEAAPVVNPNGFNGGNGGGSNWTALSAGTFGTKLEVQSNHSFAGSLTKVRGRWTHKAGTEYRNLLSHYADPEQASVAIPSPTAHTGGNFNFEYVTANGSVAQQTRINAQRGVNGAALLLGAGLWTIRPGANVLPHFSQKYFAVYSQNDWRPTPNLTLNLGLRWELQPGPTERENRMSAWDFTKANPFGTQGAVAFPGVDGYSRNLWDTEYDNWGPRIGAAYSVDPKTVVRGGFGITYLPSNTGYFSGPTDYGSPNFSGGVSQIPYGTNPRGVVAGRFSDPSPIVNAVGGDPAAPQVYGIGESRFTRQFENGRSTQWNVFVERSIGADWTASAGYTASLSRHLLNRSFPIQNLQSIDPAVLASWRDQYIASNGTINPATQLVPNPFQPATGPLLPFAGVLGAATITRQTTLFPYPLLVPGIVNSSDAQADYHALLLRVSRRLSRGLMLDATYTWSKNLEDTNTGIEDGQGFNAGGTATNWDINNRENNRMLGLSDVPHRLVALFLYEVPLSARGQASLPMRIVKTIAGDWQISGTTIWQAGYPIAISGASTGAALARPDRVEGAPLLLPEALWGWYDGRTQVTLPSGRIITPPNRTYLKYNPDAFVGRVVRTPNGSIVADQYLVRRCVTNLQRDPHRLAHQYRHQRAPQDPDCDDQPRVRRRREQRAEPYAIQRGVHGQPGRDHDDGEPGARPRGGDGQREQLRHARHGDVQPAPHDGACDVPLLKPLPHHFDRSAVAGSIRTARHAGPATDAAPVSATTAMTAANVTASRGCTPKSIVVIVRPKAADRTRPIAAPIVTMRMALETTCFRTSFVVAPSARRTPKSRTCCWTEYQSTPNTPTIASVSASPAKAITITARKRWRLVA